MLKKDLFFLKESYYPKSYIFFHLSVLIFAKN